MNSPGDHPRATPRPSGPVVYGIPNCDTVRAARRWLDAAGTSHAFHDFKKLGVPVARLAGWAQAVGWERLLNRRGTTWRTLDAATQARAVQDDEGALAVMALHPSLARRPVVEWPDGTITVGFDAEEWAARLPAPGAR